MSRITEARDVQDRIIAYLKGLGYTFIPRNDLPAWRGNSERMAFLPAVLRRQLARLNGLQAADAKLAAEEDRLAALQALFKSMLHELMTGLVRLLGDGALPA